MLKYTVLLHECHIVVSHSLTDDEILQIKELLSEEFSLFTIAFNYIYTIDAVLVDILHTALENKKIEITVNKSRLSKYLNLLGIKSVFVSDLSGLKVLNPNAYVLAIGGSANSSAKIIEILSSIDTRKYIIFIIQHIDPEKDAYFDKILQEYVQSKVSYVYDGMKIQKAHIYIASKNKHMLVKDSKIYLSDTEALHYARPSISASFNSISEAYKENLVALLTCGYADDGVDSLNYLKHNRSSILIQNPKECEADSIPLEAIGHHIYDYVLETQDIVRYISTLGMNFTSNEQWIEYLLEEVFYKYEYDFRKYQIDSISRRVKLFMIKHRFHDIKRVIILTLVNKAVFKSLFLDLSINVTEFFRDIPSSKKMIEILQEEYKNAYNIKIWSAGCSSGEEVYSTAIILNELNLLKKSIIYATDFNPIIIEEARNGIFPFNKYKKGKEAYAKLNLNSRFENYFRINRKFVKIDDDTRQNILFFVHNLEKDSVFNEFDIIECKNVMIYFNEELKQNIFHMFYESLKFGGHLFLGTSEVLPANFQNKFLQYSNECKIYKKVS